MVLKTLSKNQLKEANFYLPDRGFIQISGIDAEKFLQGQLTCDVHLAKAHQGMLCAHCNLKGRIIFNGYLFYNEGDYLLSMPKAQVQTAIIALKKYAIFSKVAIEEVSESVLSTLKPFKTEVNSENLKLNAIQAGIAEIYPETREKFTPHEMNYHQLNAISFEKGCYVGQEVIARMHYRGKLKTELRQASCSLKCPPKHGEEIFHSINGKQEIAGYIVDFAKAETHYLLLVCVD